MVSSELKSFVKSKLFFVFITFCRAKPDFKTKCVLSDASLLLLQKWWECFIISMIMYVILQRSTVLFKFKILKFMCEFSLDL